MFFCDTHAHINLFNNWIDIINNAIAKNITQIWIPSLIPDDIPKLAKIRDNFPNVIKIMVGLYPAYVYPESWVHEIKKIEKYLTKNEELWNISFIGEIGIDLKLNSYYNEQLKALQTQLEFAQATKLPVSLHRRKFTKNILDILKNFQDVKLILHCFNHEDLIIIDDISKWHNVYIGINGIILRENEKKTIEAIKKNNIEKILFETDAPYLNPLSKDNPNEPANIPYIIEKFSQLLNTNAIILAEKAWQFSLSLLENNKK